LGAQVKGEPGVAEYNSSLSFQVFFKYWNYGKMEDENESISEK